MELGITGFIDIAVPEGVFNAYDVSDVTEADVPAYTFLMRSIIERADFLNEDERMELLATKTEEYYRKCLEDRSKRTLLVARDGEAVVGVLEGSKEHKLEDFGFVHWVCVADSYRGKGVGQSLYANYEQVLKRQGISRMVATIHNDNTPSLKMHEQFGFDMLHPYEDKYENRKSYNKFIDISGGQAQFFGAPRG